MRRAHHLSLIGAALTLVATADAQPRAAIPQLASAEFGWLADTEFLPPANGPGPVTFDRAHPYVRNNTPGQPTFRIADTNNPILQPWVVARMNEDNREVLAGKFACAVELLAGGRTRIPGVRMRRAHGLLRPGAW